MNQNDLIVARLAALEILSASCLTFLLASAGEDPTLSKTRAVLDVLNADADEGLKDLPQEMRDEAKRYLTNITSNILENVTALRGGVGTSQ